LQAQSPEFKETKQNKIKTKKERRKGGREGRRKGWREEGKKKKERKKGRKRKKGREEGMKEERKRGKKRKKGKKERKTCSLQELFTFCFLCKLSLTLNESILNWIGVTEYRKPKIVLRKAWTRQEFTEQWPSKTLSPWQSQDGRKVIII
jgi:hypothetical protein